MTTLPQHSRTRRRQAFTLPDYMVGLALTITVFGLTLGSYLYGAKMYRLASARFETIEENRPLMGRIIHDVRAAASVQVGNGGAAGFTRAASGQPQRGNALQVYPGMNTNRFVRYYVDAADQSLKRIKHDDQSPSVLAGYVVNATPFTLEDISGNVVTNDPTVATVGVTIQSDRPVFGERETGTNRTANANKNWTCVQQVTTRVTPRTTLGFQQGQAAP